MVDSTVCYDPAYLNRELKRVLAEDGIADVASAIEILRLAKRVGDAAVDEPDAEAREELRAVAAELRRTKGSPNPKTIRLANTMVVAPVKVDVDPASGVVKVTGQITYLTPDRWRPYVNLPHRAIVAAPCCVKGEIGRAHV